VRKDGIRRGFSLQHVSKPLQTVQGEQKLRLPTDLSRQPKAQHAFVYPVCSCTKTQVKKIAHKFGAQLANNGGSAILIFMPLQIRKAITENYKKNVKKLRLKEVNGRELELLVQFAYLKKCDDLQQDDKVALVELVKAAKYMQMNELEAELLETLKRNIDMTAAFKVLANRE
jgi:hypothetical protein